MLHDMEYGRNLRDEHLKKIDALFPGEPTTVATVMTALGAVRTVDTMRDVERRLGLTLRKLRLRRRNKERREVEFVAKQAGVDLHLLPSYEEGLFVRDEILEKMAHAFPDADFFREMLEDKDAPDFNKIES